MGLLVNEGLLAIVLTATVVVPCCQQNTCTGNNYRFRFCPCHKFSMLLSRGLRLKPLAAAPLATATAEIVLASAAGAAWTEFAETAPAMIVPESATPRLVKNFRSFSSARFTRIFCRVLARAQRRAYFRQVFVFEESEHEWRCDLSRRAGPSRVQQRRDLPPGLARLVGPKWIAYKPPVRGVDGGFRRADNSPPSAARFDIASRKHGVLRQLTCFSGQDDENRLRDFLRARAGCQRLRSAAE